MPSGLAIFADLTEAPEEVVLIGPTQGLLVTFMPTVEPVALSTGPVYISNLSLLSLPDVGTGRSMPTTIEGSVILEELDRRIIPYGWQNT